MFTPVDMVSVHLAAIADYEREADELDRDACPYTAKLFRDAAEKRRNLIAEMDERSQDETKQGELIAA